MKERIFKLRVLNLCGKYLIDFSMAMENDNFEKAYKDQNFEKMEQILQEEF